MTFNLLNYVIFIIYHRTFVHIERKWPINYTSPSMLEQTAGFGPGGKLYSLTVCGRKSFSDVPVIFF